MFSCVSKEERFFTIIHNLEVLNAEKKKEQATALSSMSKRRVGHSRKEIKLHLFKPKVEKSMKK
jgi:hypothetical protein